MFTRVPALLLAASVSLAACVPTAPMNTVANTGSTIGQPVYTQPTGQKVNTGSTTPPPKFDRNGNPNYDENGTYIGGNGLGTLVDSPDTSTPDVPDITVPDVSMPDVSNMNCTSTQTANAGSMTCSN